MNKRLVLKLVGTVMLVEAILLLLPLGVSLLCHSGDHMAFVAAIAVSGIVGGALHLIPAADDTLHAREGCAVVDFLSKILELAGSFHDFRQSLTVTDSDSRRVISSVFKL